MRLANHTPKDGVKNVAKKIQKSSVVRGLEKKAVDYGTKALRDVAEPAVDALADTAATALGNPELAAPLDLAIHKGADYLQRKGADYLDQKIDSDGPLLSSDAPVLSSDGPPCCPATPPCCPATAPCCPAAGSSRSTGLCRLYGAPPGVGSRPAAGVSTWTDRFPPTTSGLGILRNLANGKGGR
jgi:hypothetical protein